MFSFFTCSASIMIKALLRQCLPCSQSQLKLCCIQLWKLWIGEIMCMYPAHINKSLKCLESYQKKCLGKRVIRDKQADATK